MLAGVRAEVQHILRLVEVGDLNGVNRKWISYLGRVPADLLASYASVSSRYGWSSYFILTAFSLSIQVRFLIFLFEEHDAGSMC
jgi:sugar phosphate permease